MGGKGKVEIVGINIKRKTLNQNRIAKNQRYKGLKFLILKSTSKNCNSDYHSFSFNSLRDLQRIKSNRYQNEFHLI